MSISKECWTKYGQLNTVNNTCTYSELSQPNKIRVSFENI